MAAPSERIAAGAQAACLPVYLADGENCLADEKTPAENEQKMWNSVHPVRHILIRNTGFGALHAVIQKAFEGRRREKVSENVP